MCSRTLVILLLSNEELYASWREELNRKDERKAEREGMGSGGRFYFKRNEGFGVEGGSHGGGRVLYLGVIAKDKFPPLKLLHFVIDTIRPLPYCLG